MFQQRILKLNEITMVIFTIRFQTPLPNAYMHETLFEGYSSQKMINYEEKW